LVHVLDITYGNTYVDDGGSSEMTILNASDARANLYRLIDQTNESHEPVIISGKRNNAILLSEDDWKSIQETLYLISIPGMRESIVEGMKEPLSESSKELDW
jgi:antitoxin YefM